METTALEAGRLLVISPVARRGDEVDAAVHAGVRDPLLPVDVDLLLQVGFVLVVDELHDGLPAGGKAAQFKTCSSNQTFVVQYCGYFLLSETTEGLGGGPGMVGCNN